MTPRLSLVTGLVALVLWAYCIFVRQVQGGLPNGLYALGILLLVRWMVLKPDVISPSST